MSESSLSMRVPRVVSSSSGQLAAVHSPKTSKKYEHFISTTSASATTTPRGHQRPQKEETSVFSSPTSSYPPSPSSALSDASPRTIMNTFEKAMKMALEEEEARQEAFGTPFSSSPAGGGEFPSSSERRRNKNNKRRHNNKKKNSFLFAQQSGDDVSSSGVGSPSSTAASFSPFNKKKSEYFFDLHDDNDEDEGEQQQADEGNDYSEEELQQRYQQQMREKDSSDFDDDDDEEDYDDIFRHAATSSNILLRKSYEHQKQMKKKKIMLRKQQQQQQERQEKQEGEEGNDNSNTLKQVVVEGPSERLLRKERERHFKLIDRAKVIARRLLRNTDREIEKKERLAASVYSTMNRSINNDNNNNNNVLAAVASGDGGGVDKNKENSNKEQQQEQDHSVVDEIEAEMEQKFLLLSSKLDVRTTALKEASQSLDSWRSAQQERTQELFAPSQATQRHLERKLQQQKQEQFFSSSTLLSSSVSGVQNQQQLSSAAAAAAAASSSYNSLDRSILIHSENFLLVSSIVESVFLPRLFDEIDQVEIRLAQKRIDDLDVMNKREAARREGLRQEAEARARERRRELEMSWVTSASGDEMLAKIRADAMQRRREEEREKEEQLTSDLQEAEHSLHLVQLKIDREYRVKFEAEERKKSMAPRDLLELRLEMEALEREEKIMIELEKERERERQEKVAAKEEEERQKREVEEAERGAKELEERLMMKAMQNSSSANVIASSQQATSTSGFRASKLSASTKTRTPTRTPNLTPRKV